jgi:hypothetical protein
MTARPQHEQLIARYLSGAMSDSERRSFLEGAERDPALKQQLRAEQLITRAVERDRSAIPAPSAASRAQFLSMLEGVSSEDSPTTPPAGNPASSPLRYLPGGARTIGAVIVAGALIVGTILFTPSSNAPRNSAKMPAPAQTTAPAAVSAPQVTAPEPAAQTNAAQAPASAPEVSAAAPAATEHTTGRMNSASTSRAVATRSQRQIARDQQASSRHDAAKNQPATSNKPNANGQTYNDPAHGHIKQNDPTIKKQ